MNLKSPPPKLYSGMATIREIPISELEDNLAVITIDRGIYKRVIYFKKVHDMYSKYYEFVISDEDTRLVYPIVRSQWTFIIEHNYLYTFKPFAVYQYDYDNSKSERAKILTQEYIDSKLLVKYEISKEEVLDIVRVLSPKTSQSERDIMSNKLKNKYKLYGSKTSKRKRI
jgi:hypothetical protein